MSTFNLEYPRGVNGSWRGFVSTSTALPANPLNGDTYVVLDTKVITWWDATGLAWVNMTGETSELTGSETATALTTVVAGAVEVAVKPSGISHTNITNIGTNTHAQIDTHIGTSNIHFTEASINHANITGAGTNAHSTIDSHIGASNIHFTEASISHANITNIGTNTHAQIDSHIGTSNIHFTEASISHANILNVGTNSHTQIDTHIADIELHQATPVTQYIFDEDFVSYINENNQLTTGLVGTGTVGVSPDADWSSFVGTCIGAAKQSVTKFSTSDASFIRQGTGGSTGGNQIPINSGDITFITRIAVSALSDGSDAYTFICGLVDESTQGAITNGIFFEVGADIVDNYIKCVTCASSTATTNTSTVAPVADTFIDLKFIKTSSNVKFYINNVLKFTVTTNIPTVNCHLESNLEKTAGDDVTCKVWTDFIQLKIKTSR